MALADLACMRGARRVFGGVSVDVAPGCLLRVVGANGAGKTSLLRMVCGLLAPSHGEVRWRGRPVQAQREALGRERVWLGHTAALKDDLSAAENIGVAEALAGRPPRPDHALAALAAAGLGARAHQPVRLLSQGQRQRVALARLLLAGTAALWVLDEPFNALDAAASSWLAGLIGTHLDRGGVVVLASHQAVAVGDVRRERTLSL